MLWNKNKTIHQLSAFLGVYDSSCQDLLELLLPKHARLHTKVFEMYLPEGNSPNF